MRELLKPLTVLTALNIFTLPVYAELGSGVPSDAQLLTERAQEAGSAGSGIFDIAVPPAGTVLRPVRRVPREKFGVVGPFPLQLQDLRSLLFPDATLEERQRCLAAGMNAHVAKPIDPALLFETLARFYQPPPERCAVANAAGHGSGSDGSSPIAPRATAVVDAGVPAVEGLDTADGLLRVAGNKTLYTKLLRQFVNVFELRRG